MKGLLGRPGYAIRALLRDDFGVAVGELNALAEALQRQRLMAAEAHGGSLSLHNREGGPGCVVRLRLPLDRPAPTDAP